MAPERLTLDGCSPTPLASYLKALGVLRLLSSAANNVSGEAADPGVRGWWEGERFHLRTTLGRDGVLGFFLHEYAPSPVIAPWNGRAGFLEGVGHGGQASTREGAVLMREIENSTSARLHRMRSTIRLLQAKDELVSLDALRAEVKSLDQRAKGLAGSAKRECLERKRLVEARAKTVKGLLLPSLRSTIGHDHVDYVDSCFVIPTEAQSARAAPLLGAGGLDGSRDFGVRFAAALRQTLDFVTDDPVGDAAQNLRAALFRTAARLDKAGSIGMFRPGDVGPNATTGFSGKNALNPWDVLLVMEGTIVFAGALTRRWESKGRRGASFPFTFEPIQAGSGGFSPEDPHRPRGEIWTPLWGKPARYSELRAVFSEGRLTTSGGSARNGLDAARSVAQMGASRGITSFERYSLIQPGSSLPYQATPLGRVNTPEVPRPDLIGNLEAGGWLQSARKAAGERTAPGRARVAMHRLEDSLFEMTDGSRAADGIRRTIVGLGNFMSWLATNPADRKTVCPPPLLSRAWLLQADDGSPEFRIAAALASLGLSTPARGEESGSAESHPRSVKAPPMAAHFAPLTNGPADGFEERTFFRHRWLRKRRAWAGDNSPPTVVWGHGGLVANMIAVLERRLVEAPIRGLVDKPLSSASFARMSDVAAFLTGEFDDGRCSALLAGMVWAQPVWFPKKETESVPTATALPFAYAALKPIFSPNAALVHVGAIPGEGTLPIPPGLVGQLRAGGNGTDGRATDRAVRTALSRARSSGLSSPYDSIRFGGRPTARRCSRIGVGIRADRLAAALLIPVFDKAVASSLRRAYPGVIPDTTTHPLEDKQNVT